MVCKSRWLCMIAASGLVLAVTSCGATDDDMEYETKVVGGHPADPGEFPWQVHLLSTGRHFCGGSLINAHWVVTAAHCFYEEIDPRITVVLGDHDRIDSSGKEIRRSAEELFIHPDFNDDNFSNDIALILLDAPVEEYNNFVRPIRLASGNDGPGLNAVLSGWGYMVGNGGEIADVLQTAELPVRAGSVCDSYFKPQFFQPALNICTGFVDGSRASCYGDSGGPLAIQRGNGNWELIGVTSFGAPSCGGYTVFARVSHYVDWVNEIVVRNTPRREKIYTERQRIYSGPSRTDRR